MQHKIEEVVSYWPHIEDDTITDLDFDEKSKTMRIIISANLYQYSESDQEALKKIYGPFENCPATESLLVKLTFYDVELAYPHEREALKILAEGGWGYFAWNFSFESGVVGECFEQEGTTGITPEQDLRFRSSGFDAERVKQRYFRNRHFPLVDVKRQIEKL